MWEVVGEGCPTFLVFLKIILIFWWTLFLVPFVSKAILINNWFYVGIVLKIPSPLQIVKNLCVTTTKVMLLETCYILVWHQWHLNLRHLNLHLPATAEMLRDDEDWDPTRVIAGKDAKFSERRTENVVFLFGGWGWRVGGRVFYFPNFLGTNQYTPIILLLSIFQI